MRKLQRESGAFDRSLTRALTPALEVMMKLGIMRMMKLVMMKPVMTMMMEERDKGRGR